MAPGETDDEGEKHTDSEDEPLSGEPNDSEPIYPNDSEPAYHAEKPSRSWRPVFDSLTGVISVL